mgnify:FL=1
MVEKFLAPALQAVVPLKRVLGVVGDVVRLVKFAESGDKTVDDCVIKSFKSSPSSL